MKVFIHLKKKIAENKKLCFIKDTAIFLLLFLALYVYLIQADLSTAPEFIYSQF